MFPVAFRGKVIVYPAKNLAWLSKKIKSKGENLLAEMNGIMNLIFSMKQHQKGSRSFLMLIWENILDSVLGSIKKAFKINTYPDLCRNALNFYCVIFSELQPCLPCGKSWMAYSVPCWANSILLQPELTNFQGWIWRYLAACEGHFVGWRMLWLMLGCGTLSCTESTILKLLQSNKQVYSLVWAAQ